MKHLEEENSQEKPVYVNGQSNVAFSNSSIELECKQIKKLESQYL